MSKPIGYVAVLALTGVCLNAGASFTVPPDPPLPVGWELGRDTSFEPCIELCIEEDYRRVCTWGPTDKMKARMAEWGPAAVPILMRYAEDARWTTFHPTIVGYLSAVETDELRAWANVRMRALLARKEWTTDECYAFRSFGGVFRGALERETLDLAAARMVEFAGIVRAERQYTTEAEEICTVLKRACPEECATALERGAAEGSDQRRLACCQQLMRVRPDSAVPAAFRLGDEVADRRLRRELCSIVHWEAGESRGREPMSWIVDEERSR